MAASDSSGGPVRVFRNQETRFMSGAFAVGSALFALITLSFPMELWARLVWFTLLGLASVAFVVRGMRQGIYVDERGLEVRGAFSSRYLVWSEIRRFDLRKGIRDVVAYIDLEDGSSVPARALNAGTGILPAMNRRAQAQADDLNRLLAEAKERSAE
jgi:hypothetical protein